MVLRDEGAHRCGRRLGAGAQPAHHGGQRERCGACARGAAWRGIDRDHGRGLHRHRQAPGNRAGAAGRRDSPGHRMVGGAAPQPHRQTARGRGQGADQGPGAGQGATARLRRAPLPRREEPVPLPQDALQGSGQEYRSAV